VTIDVTKYLKQKNNDDGEGYQVALYLRDMVWLSTQLSWKLDDRFAVDAVENSKLSDCDDTVYCRCCRKDADKIRLDRILIACTRQRWLPIYAQGSANIKK